MIVARSPRECLLAFEGSSRRLVAHTLTRQYPIWLYKKDDRWGRLQSHSTGSLVSCGIPLKTKFGKVFLVLSQLVFVHQVEDGFALRMGAYTHQVKDTQQPKAMPLFRWSGDPSRSDGEAAADLHMDASVIFGALGSVDLGRVRTPTGFVSPPDIVRFLIADLDVPPPCGADAWEHEVSLAVEWYTTLNT